MTIQDIKSACREAIELNEKATPGPWEVGGPYPQVSVIKVRGWDGETGQAIADPIAILGITGDPNTTANDPDATFIALSRTLCPAFAQALLTAIEALERVSKQTERPTDIAYAAKIALRSIEENFK